MQIASYIDHTILRPFTSTADVEKLCGEAAEYNFAAVCIPPPYIRRCRDLLAPTSVKVATVIGFPFGYSATEAKIAETVLAIVDGAHELDVVINLIALRNGDWTYLEKEVSLLLEIIHGRQKICKIIIESGSLTNQEIIRCCETFGKLGIDYLKTSTGYSEKGASVDAIRLMRTHLPQSVKIKASGGIRTYEQAIQMINAGADRLGCSASVDIVNGK